MGSRQRKSSSRASPAQWDTLRPWPSLYDCLSLLPWPLAEQYRKGLRLREDLRPEAMQAAAELMARAAVCLLPMLELQRLIAAGESETLELKRSTGQLNPAEQTRCAFLEFQERHQLGAGLPVLRASAASSV